MSCTLSHYHIFSAHLYMKKRLEERVKTKIISLQAIYKKSKNQYIYINIFSF